ncbi:MAG: glycosyltransferase family 4 protein [Patescibacteria group bacterium]
MVSARGADVIYAQDTVSVGLPAALTAFCLGKRFMVRIPGDYAWEQGRQRFGITDTLDVFQQKTFGIRIAFLRTVQRFVVNQAEQVIVPSEYMKTIVSHWTSARKISVIYSGVEMPVPTKVSRPEGFFVVTIARPVPWKGLEGLTRVVAREKNWHLMIVNNLPYEQAMGYVQAADVFVINSTYEGLSHALIEAMMLGTPVVATRVGGNPELVRDTIDGLLIEPNNDEELYVALRSIALDKTGARARVEAARIRARSFTIEHSLMQLRPLLSSTM